MGSKFFPFKVDLFQTGEQETKQDITKVVPSPLKILETTCTIISTIEFYTVPLPLHQLIWSYTVCKDRNGMLTGGPHVQGKSHYMQVTEPYGNSNWFTCLLVGVWRCVDPHPPRHFTPGRFARPASPCSFRCPSHFAPLKLK